MRAEEILKESELFANEDECYIHCEKTAGGVYNIIITGDPKTIMCGVFAILKRLSDVKDITFRTILHTLKKMDKKTRYDAHENEGFWR